MIDSTNTILGRLICLPTSRTSQRLRYTFSQPPLTLDPWETLHVTVAKAFDEASVVQLSSIAQDVASDKEVDPTYVFAFKDVDYVYDPVLGASKLMGTLHCPALDAVRSILGTHLRPLHLQFLHQAPPLSRSIKSFVISVADTLVYKEKDTPFTLGPLYYLTEKEYVSFFKAHYVGLSDEAIGGELV